MEVPKPLPPFPQPSGYKLKKDKSVARCVLEFTLVLIGALLVAFRRQLALRLLQN
jgi:hypothetical protein